MNSFVGNKLLNHVQLVLGLFDTNYFDTSAAGLGHKLFML